MQGSLQVRWGKFFSIVLYALASPALAQYSSPESVEYDAHGDRYFVSNVGSQLIRVLDQEGTVTTFVNVGASPYGLEVLNGVLYVCASGGIKGYSLVDTSLVFEIALGGSFVNGITTDGQYLYASDFGAGRLYKVDVQAATFSILVGNTNGTPNGLVWDPVGERLVVVFWGGNAAIRSFDRHSGAGQTLVTNSGLGNIDGITIDCNGDFLVASWEPDRITRFGPTFSLPGTDVGITGLNNPADIDFDQVNNKLCIPNSGSNTVMLADVSCTAGIRERRVYNTRVIPNPTSGRVHVEPAFQRAEPFMVLDAQGRLQATGTLRAGAALDLGDLPTGPYMIVFTRRVEQVRVMKE